MGQKKTVLIPGNLISCPNELYHYGMPRRSGRYPWGSGERPYQGDKIDKTPAKKLYKQMKKEIQNRRGEFKGNQNKYMRITGIGTESDKLIKERGEKERAYKKSKEYKDWLKKYNELNEKLKSGQIDQREWEIRDKALYELRPKKDFNSLAYAKVLSNRGFIYVDNYLNKGGKDLSMAYLKDLEYTEKDIQKIINKITSINKTLADV